MVSPSPCGGRRRPRPRSRRHGTVVRWQHEARSPLLEPDLARWHGGPRSNARECRAGGRRGRCHDSDDDGPLLPDGGPRWSAGADARGVHHPGVPRRQTSDLELGPLVTGVTYRHPGVLAKIVTTLDVLSGGRAMFGIGAAWYEREHRGLGVPYPSTTERFE